VKLLLDANISWKLCSRLSGIFGECYHVDFIELTVPARDIEIWQYALENELNIVTNDEDF
jgi:predicted nuclease of predicted toxin-antitoxin system